MFIYNINIVYIKYNLCNKYFDKNIANKKKKKYININIFFIANKSYLHLVI